MTIAQLFALMRRKWIFILTFTLLVGVLTAGYCWYFMPNEYSASTSLYVLKKGQTKDGAISLDTTTSLQIATDTSDLATTDRVRDGAAQAAGLASLDDFDISISSESSNRVIFIEVTGPTATSVAKVADAMAAQISEVAVEVMDLQAINVIDQAKVPESPSGPNRPRYVIAAVLGGFLAAVIIVMLREALDNTVKSADEAEQSFGYPMLGVLPDVGKEAQAK